MNSKLIYLMVLSASIFFSPITTMFSQNITWTGSTDNNWHRTCNWNTNAIPTSSDNVYIRDPLTNNPTVTNDANCKTINIESNAANAVNITTGSLCISSTNSGACPVATNLGGCCVAGTWSAAANLGEYGCSPCPAGVPQTVGSPCACIGDENTYFTTMLCTDCFNPTPCCFEKLQTCQ